MSGLDTRVALSPTRYKRTVRHVGVCAAHTTYMRTQSHVSVEERRQVMSDEAKSNGVCVWGLCSERERERERERGQRE